MSAINKLLTTIVAATAIFSVAALTLVLLLWLGERRKETGILLATGVGKRSMLAQYLTENLLLFVVALGASYALVLIAAQRLGDSVVSRASRAALQSIQGSYNFAPDFNTSTSQKTIDSVSAVISPTYLLTVGGAGQHSLWWPDFLPAHRCCPRRRASY